MEIAINQPDINLPKMKKIKIYSALITQTGTDDPTVTVLQNDFGEEIVWTRQSTGYYLGTLADAFTKGKTYATLKNTTGNTTQEAFITANVLSNIVEIMTKQVSTLTDGLMNGAPLEIRVYS